MRLRHFIGFALFVGLVAGATYSRAQLWEAWTHGSGGAAGYAGPGDTQAWDLWWGEIAYNHAYAAANGVVGTIVRASDSATCVVRFATNGTPDLTVATPCSSATATSFCNATTCSWQSFVNQGSAAANSLIKDGAYSLPTLTLTGCSGLAKMGTCAHFTNSATTHMISTAGLGQPHAPPYTALVVARMSGTPQSLAAYPLQFNSQNDLMQDVTTFGYYCTIEAQQSAAAIPSTADGNWYVLINASGSGGYCGASTNSTPNAGTGTINFDAPLSWGADSIPAHGWEGDMLAAGIAWTGITGTVTSGNMQAIVSNIRATAGF